MSHITGVRGVVAPSTETSTFTVTIDFRDVDTDTQRAADRLSDGTFWVDRLKRDPEPTSPVSKALRVDVFTYAWRPLHAMFRDGRLFETRHGNPIHVPVHDYETLRSTYDERVALIVDTMDAAFEPFRTSLINGRWTPDGGANLGSWFIGACRNHFLTVFHTWQKNRQRYVLGLLPYEQLGFLSTADIAESAATRDLLRRIRTVCSPETWTTCELLGVGYTPAEVADQLKITPAAVRQRMHRLRRDLQKRHEQGEFELPPRFRERHGRQPSHSTGAPTKTSSGEGLAF